MKTFLCFLRHVVNSVQGNYVHFEEVHVEWEPLQTSPSSSSSSETCIVSERVFFSREVYVYIYIRQYRILAYINVYFFSLSLSLAPYHELVSEFKCEEVARVWPASP